MLLVHDNGDVIATLIARMVAAGAWLPVIAFSEAADTPRVVSAILRGAVDYALWPFEGPAFVATLASAQDRANAAGNARLREAVARSRIDRLTPREREVLQGVASGHSNRVIAEQLDISPRTVEIHRANMLNKIGASHTSEAIRIAIEASLVS
jgi:FixJ family two-component response regulator